MEGDRRSPALVGRHMTGGGRGRRTGVGVGRVVLAGTATVHPQSGQTPGRVCPQAAIHSGSVLMVGGSAPRNGAHRPGPCPGSWRCRCGGNRRRCRWPGRGGAPASAFACSQTCAMVRGERSGVGVPAGRGWGPMGRRGRTGVPQGITDPLNGVASARIIRSFFIASSRRRRPESPLGCCSFSWRATK